MLSEPLYAPATPVALPGTLSERDKRTLRERVVPVTLDFLLQDGSEASLRLSQELWLESPESFEDLHQVAFAERGGEEFRRECEDLVEIYDPLVDEPPFYAAAFLAFEGDGAGRDILASFMTSDDPERLEGRILCALALQRLEDSNAWSWMIDRMRRRIEGLLERANIRAAAESVLLLEHFALVQPRESLSVIAVILELSEHLVQRRKEIGTEEQVRTLLATLIPN
jgi:hypothetical protein